MRASVLSDVTTDASALESRGFWIAVVPYDGVPLFARFDRVTPARDEISGNWTPVSKPTWRTSLSREQYEDAVEQARQAIAVGDVYQANLCRVLSAPMPNGSTIASLGALLRTRHAAPYSATVIIPSHGVAIASASPECFLRRSGTHVCSRPIKGTAAENDQFADKDSAENVMIVDLVRNDLGLVCETGSVHVTGLLEREAHPGLAHLVSTVCGELPAGKGWPQLLDAAFPPGSVTGAPKLAALQFIDKLEPVSRGPYCGAIGWVDADRKIGELNVAIRTFWQSAGELHFGTGAGITWESDPASEWQETELKAAKLIALASR